LPGAVVAGRRTAAVRRCEYSSAGGCAGYGSADLQQEGSGVVFNGKIAFERLPDGGTPPYDDIYVIDVDTAGICTLTSTAAEFQVSASPTWSPHGNKIASYDKNAINVTNTDGSGLKKLTDTVPVLSAHAWSPEGERIAFAKLSDLYVINADGTERKRVTLEVGPESFLGPEGFLGAVSWGRG
jgi:hypothetical protein